MDQNNHIHKSKKGSIILAIIVLVIVILSAVFILIQKNTATLSAQSSQSATMGNNVQTILDSIKNSSSPGISAAQKEEALASVRENSGTSTLSSEQKTIILNQIKQQ